MNDRYPDATEQEIQTQDVCIICREGMRAWQPNDQNQPNAPPQSPGDERLRPKKLPCGHILHFSCLRSWLERQQNCPTCRQPVLTTTTTTAATTTTTPETPAPPRDQNREAQANGAQADNNPQADQPPRQRPNGENRLRFFNFGPLRVGFAAGRGGGRDAEQHLQDFAARNGRMVRQYGFSINVGRGNPPTQPSAEQTSTNTNAQIQAIERQIMQEANNLRLRSEQLHVLRAMQGELARLRIAQAASAVFNQTTSQQPQEAIGLPDIPQIQPQTHITAYGVNNNQERIQSGSRALPPGVAIPEGWTLLPLQPLVDQAVTSNIPYHTTFPGLSRQTRSAGHSGQSSPRIPSFSTNIHHPNTHLPDITNHSFSRQDRRHSSEVNPEIRTETPHQSTSRPVTESQEPATPHWSFGQSAESDKSTVAGPSSDTEGQADLSSEKGPDIKGKGRATTVEDGTESD
jgi:E3 ubiquitin-protein ligase synoviolin